jgi:hypothetical protein
MAVTFASCSNPKADFDETKKLLDANEVILSNSVDYQLKLKTCDNSIAFLRSFISKHEKGEWVDVARGTLEMWTQKRVEIEKTINTLVAKLEKAAIERAAEEAKDQHVLTIIKTYDVESNPISFDGSGMYINGKYMFHLQGAIFGIDRYDVAVELSAHYDYTSQKIEFSKILAGDQR